MDRLPGPPSLSPSSERASVSVVVVWSGEAEALGSWLRGIAEVGAGSSIEVIAVGKWTKTTTIEQPAGMVVRLVPEMVGAGNAARRRAAVEAATGHIVLVADEADLNVRDRLSELLSRVEGRATSWHRARALPPSSPQT